MNGAEQESGEPNRYVNVLCCPMQLRLDESPEDEFLTKSGEYGDYNKGKQEFACRCKMGERFGQFCRRVFPFARPPFKFTEKIRKVHMSVPFDENGVYRHENYH